MAVTTSGSVDRVEKGFGDTKFNINIVDENGVVMVPVGAHAIESWGGNARIISATVCRATEIDLAPANRNYRVVRITVKTDGTATYKLYNPGHKYDTIIHSLRTPNNVYASGLSGVGFSKDNCATWTLKNGNLSALLGGLPIFKKVEPLIKP